MHELSQYSLFVIILYYLIFSRPFYVIFLFNSYFTLCAQACQGFTAALESAQAVLVLPVSETIIFVTCTGKTTHKGMLLMDTPIN